MDNDTFYSTTIVVYLKQVIIYYRGTKGIDPDSSLRIVQQKIVTLSIYLFIPCGYRLEFLSHLTVFNYRVET